MKSLVFDAGPIITLTMNNLLWILDPLKRRMKGDFYITPTVKGELVDTPLQTRKYKFEALQVLKYISQEVLDVVSNDEISEKAHHLQELANTSFKAKDNYLKIVHYPEMESLASAIALGSSALVVDERTTSRLIEDPQGLGEWMKSKLHTKVAINHESIEEFRREVGSLKVIRSAELIILAFEFGLLDQYITDKEKKSIPDIRRTLLESVLWGARLNGCAISETEIERVLAFEARQS